MHRLLRMRLVVLLGFAAITGASECPTGDLSGDCAIDFDDVWTLALSIGSTLQAVRATSSAAMGSIWATSLLWRKTGASPGRRL